MLHFLKKFFDYNEKQLSQLRKKTEEISKLEDKARGLKDSQFIEETKKLKEVVGGNNYRSDEIFAWASALVREASRRVLKQRHYDVQLMAGIAMHQGKIVEQRTGEGKTLSATVPLYINALSGKGAHLVTVNDYLARRDAGWMGKIFHFLGMSTSVIISEKSFLYDPDFVDKEAQDWRLANLKPISKREAYLADITYGINSEFGFDYLRDNMSQKLEDKVQRGFNFAIIDEADSVLIDEARTPHIISAPYDEDTSKYYRYAKVVKQLTEKDYVIDEKLKTVNLNEEGIQKVESILGVDNIYEKDFDTLFYVESALKAQTLFHVDKDYIVKDNQVIIVDEFTGRLLYGRRFSEGLHQAIEAKENVPIQRESKTLATISLQNYFRMYDKLAGMTGTAATEAEEFHKIYKTDVVVIPTHRPMIREDRHDMIYKTEKGKFNAIVEEVAKNYKSGRPVLVGTTSIDKNEYLSLLLNKRGVPHQTLNAKNHLKEASIIANAGKKFAVTVATNMAGRGVDIVLGGTPLSDESGKISKKVQAKWQKEHDAVIELGGLYVIGTERHESRRIDNQLRGRSGRQGDPGASVFFVALQDDLMRIFGGEKIANMMDFLKFPEDQPLTHSMVSRAIEQAQVKVEGFNFDIRKHLVDFDDVLNRQRDIIYTLRNKILELPQKDKKKFKEEIKSIFLQEANNLISGYTSLTENLSDDDLSNLAKDLKFIVSLTEKDLKKAIHEIDFFNREVSKSFESKSNLKINELGENLWLEVIKMVFLSVIDRYWTDHLTSIEDLREGINLRGYAQLDPLVEYKNDAFSMFEKLINDINFEFTRKLFKTEIDNVPQKKEEVYSDKKDINYKSASAINPFSPPKKKQGGQSQKYIENKRKPKEEKVNEGEGFKVTLPGESHKKPGRNDPCWCGSGKKYKKCHYPN